VNLPYYYLSDLKLSALKLATSALGSYKSCEIIASAIAIKMERAASQAKLGLVPVKACSEERYAAQEPYWLGK